jgi:ADP-ribose pyrophosphatase YjhB (NUDIX family)
MTTVTHPHEQAVAIVTADDFIRGGCWILLIQPTNPGTWTLPGGGIETGEDAVEAARRHLSAQTHLACPGALWQRHAPQRTAGGPAATVTTPCHLELGGFDSAGMLPALYSSEHAAAAAWIRLDGLAALEADLRDRFDGTLDPGARQLLHDLLGETAWLGPVWLTPAGQRAIRDDRLQREATAYRRLREVLAAGMDDWIAFADGGLADEPTDEQLLRYAAHLATARRGDCDLCQRGVQAPDAVTELPALPWWHPRRWQLADRAAWQALTGRTPRIAHTRCAEAHQHWGLSRRLLSANAGEEASR